MLWVIARYENWFIPCLNQLPLLELPLHTTPKCLPNMFFKRLSRSLPFPEHNDITFQPNTVYRNVSFITKFLKGYYCKFQTPNGNKPHQFLKAVFLLDKPYLLTSSPSLVVG